MQKKKLAATSRWEACRSSIGFCSFFISLGDEFNGYSGRSIGKRVKNSTSIWKKTRCPLYRSSFSRGNRIKGKKPPKKGKAKNRIVKKQEEGRKRSFLRSYMFLALWLWAVNFHFFFFSSFSFIDRKRPFGKRIKNEYD